MNELAQLREALRRQLKMNESLRASNSELKVLNKILRRELNSARAGRNDWMLTARRHGASRRIQKPRIGGNR